MDLDHFAGIGKMVCKRRSKMGNNQNKYTCKNCGRNITYGDSKAHIDPEGNIFCDLACADYYHGNTFVGEDWPMFYHGIRPVVWDSETEEQNGK